MTRQQELCRRVIISWSNFARFAHRRRKRTARLGTIWCHFPFCVHTQHLCLQLVFAPPMSINKMKYNGKRKVVSWLLLIVLLPTSRSFYLASPKEWSRTRRLCLAVSSHHSSAAVAAPAFDTATAISSPLESPVIYPDISTVDDRVWKPLCPTVWENARGVVDVRQNWKRPTTSAAVTTVAKQMAASLVNDIVQQKATTTTILQQQARQADLAQALGTFMTFCDAHLQSTAVGGYSARIVATRGSPSTKCPAWHQDHVPVRWIQSLVGPGCEWVVLDNNWASTNDDDDEEDDESSSLSVDALNQRRVPAGTPTHQAAPGQAVLLVGRLWKDTCRRNDERRLNAVVHKSPSGLPPWQGRVLLTMDVLAPPHDQEN